MVQKFQEIFANRNLCKGKKIGLEIWDDFLVTTGKRDLW